MQEGIIVRCFFQYIFAVQSNSLIKSGKNFSLLLMSKFEGNLKELPKLFLVKLSLINFYSYSELILSGNIKAIILLGISLFVISLIEISLILHLIVISRSLGIDLIHRKAFTEKPSVFFQDYLYVLGQLLCLENNFWYHYWFTNNDFLFQCKVSHFPYF